MAEAEERASVLTQGARRSRDRDRASVLLERPAAQDLKRKEAGEGGLTGSWLPAGAAGQAGEGVRAVRLQRGTEGTWATT